MAKVEEARSFADLQQAERVTSSDFIASVRQYSKFGSAISSAVCIEILDKHSIDRASVLSCLPDCLHGIGDQLTRKFPEDAKQWAGLACEIGTKSKSTQFSVSAEDVHVLMAQSGLVAIELHRATGSKAKEALETGHLLSLLHRAVNADSDFDNLSMKRDNN